MSASAYAYVFLGAKIPYWELFELEESNSCSCTDKHKKGKFCSNCGQKVEEGYITDLLVPKKNNNLFSADDWVYCEEREDRILWPKNPGTRRTEEYEERFVGKLLFRSKDVIYRQTQWSSSFEDLQVTNSIITEFYGMCGLEDYVEEIKLHVWPEVSI